MKDRPLTAWIAALAILAAAGAMLASRGGFPPPVSSEIHEEIGRALAQEALQARSGNGRVTLITRDTAVFPQPAADIARAAFEKELRRGGVAATDVQLLQEDPLRPVQVPPGDFFELIRRGAPGDVIVSLMGPPLLNQEQRADLGEIKPKIVAFCPGNMAQYVNLRRLAEENLLHAAIVGRTPAAGSAARETFDQLYRRIGGQEMAQLPAAVERL